MARKKQKYYVVWQGNQPGIYESWEDCQKQVIGVAQAQYKSFEDKHEAELAYQRPYSEVKGKKTVRESMVGMDENGMTIVREGSVPGPVLDSLAVDAACSGNPGVMEYQGVYVANRQQIFHFKTPLGTNNIGEFLAIVHGLAYLKQHGLKQIIYSDSVNAINWVKRKECRTKLPLTPATAELWNYIRRAEAWLQSNTYTTEIRKWDTDNWGEIPADFGRK
ncbi:MAG: ribonuclease H family protein [Bacteroidales bacterium]|nr:ribonuclease H family protein [Bacteroidales bacterium]